MRQKADTSHIRRLMDFLGRRCPVDARIYFTGGATAVLHGWRADTIDTDIKIEPDSDEILKILPEAKESLNINIELACPADFIPPPPGWRERSVWIARHGRVDFLHYDLYAQALAKIERGHRLDVDDVQAMLRLKLIEPALLQKCFSQIASELYRYPAVDAPTFRREVDKIVKGYGRDNGMDSETPEDNP